MHLKRKGVTAKAIFPPSCPSRLSCDLHAQLKVILSGANALCGHAFTTLFHVYNTNLLPTSNCSCNLLLLLMLLIRRRPIFLAYQIEASMSLTSPEVKPGTAWQSRVWQTAGYSKVILGSDPNSPPTPEAASRWSHDAVHAGQDHDKGG